VTEDDLLGAILDLCRLKHLHVHHCRPAKTERGWRTPIQGEPGFVDMVIVGDNGVLFRELKADRGRLSAEQQQWLNRLAFARADAAVWRPAQLRDGTIVDQLRAVA
jgi:hypothetical protein